LREMARVLRPGGWATVVFHNTDAAVWQIIHDAAEAAGFSFHEASSLDRQQQSHKGYKGRSETEDVGHFDVICNLRKSQQPTRRAGPAKQMDFDLPALVERLAADPEVSRRGLQGVHAEVMRWIVSEGIGTFVDYAEVRACWKRLRPR